MTINAAWTIPEHLKEVTVVSADCHDCDAVAWEPGQVRRLCSEHLLKATGKWGTADDLMQKAQKIVHGERAQNYGKPENNFAKIALVFSGLLRDKLKSNVTPKEVALLMIGLKMCRETWQHTEDNFVDILGYLICATQIEESTNE